MIYKETETVELKKSTAELKEAIISLSAILNKHGKGKILFGIKDDGEIIGQSVGKATVRDITQAISAHLEPRIYPKINIFKAMGENVISVEFEGNHGPYFAYGRAYMRVGDSDKQLSIRELERLFLKRNQESHRGEKEISELSVNDLSIKVVKDFVSKANKARRINYQYDNVPNVLKKLGLLKGRKIIKAAEALFGNKKLLEVQAAVFAGVDKVKFLDIQQFKGNIFSLLERTESYIKERMRWRVEIKGLERDEIPEIPVDAIREALVNSLCHRDYYAPESNKVAIFKNRIEIYNPGSFPEGLTPEDFINKEEQSVLRNPFIAETLYKCKDIEKWGSGLKRIDNDCKAQGVKVEFKALKTGFIVIFYRPEEVSSRAALSVSSNTTQKLPRNYPERFLT